MPQFALLGLLSPKHVSWISPLWLLGVGALAGLVLVALLLGIFFLLSRIPALGTAVDERRRFWRATAIGTGLVILVMAAAAAIDVVGGFRTGGAELGSARLGRVVALSVPAVLGAWIGVMSFLALCSRRLMGDLEEALTEGFMIFFLGTVVALAIIGVAGSFALRPPTESWKIVGSLLRYPHVGTSTYHYQIPASDDPKVLRGLEPPPATPIKVQFRANELRALTIKSTEDVSVAALPNAAMDTPDSLEVRVGEPFTWRKRRGMSGTFGAGELDTFYVRNRGSAPADVTFVVQTDIVYPQAWIVPLAALTIAGMVLLYLALRTLAPAISAVALATFKSETAQPLFLILLAATCVFLLFSIYAPYRTLDEDIKLLKDAGLNVIMVVCMIVAVWGASTTVADEIEGQTALTVLSKPLTRRSFVIGKFTGITWTVALMYLVLGLLFLTVVSYKVIYDAREQSKESPSWEVCFGEVVGTMMPLFLSFLEAMVFAAIAVAIATRLPMLANFMICFTLYGVGHLRSEIVSATLDRFPIVEFFARLSSVLVPGMEFFSSDSAIDAGLAVPAQYVGLAALYSGTIMLISLLLALLLFEDRDVS